MAAKVTRVRFEASAFNERELLDRLGGCMEDAVALYGAPWEIEKSETQDAKTGKWGYVTLRRPNAHMG